MLTQMVRNFVFTGSFRPGPKSHSTCHTYGSEAKVTSHVQLFVTPWTTARQVIYLIYLNFNSPKFLNRDNIAYFMDKKCIYTMYIICRNVYRKETYTVWNINPRNMLPNTVGTNYMWLFKSNLDRLKLNKI